MPEPPDINEAAMPHHNGDTEDIDNKTKLIKRQAYGRASLLRHRILLG
ncbi:hypothetical protein ACE14D_01155 [Streptomyces sp. Act-28]